MMLEKNVKKGGAVVLLLVPAAFVILPILILLSGSLMDTVELKGYVTTVFTDGNEWISWKFLPDFPSFENYGKLLFETPQFFVLFHEIGPVYPGRAADLCGSGGMGFCGVSGKRRKGFICPLRGPDAAALSGNDAF